MNKSADHLYKSVVTQQPISNGISVQWIPAIERAVIRLGVYGQPDPDDNPPEYSSLFPETSEKFDSSISKAFETNAWRDTVINDQQFFKNLNKADFLALQEAVDTPHANPYSLKVALEVANEQKCSSFQEFLKIFAFVKNYLITRQIVKSTSIDSNATRNSRFVTTSPMEVASSPMRSNVAEPFSCWWWNSHPHPSPGCYCCCCCCNSGENEGVVPQTDDNCSECCGDCDCDCF